MSASCVSGLLCVIMWPPVCRPHACLASCVSACGLLCVRHVSGMVDFLHFCACCMRSTRARVHYIFRFRLHCWYACTGARTYQQTVGLGGHNISSVRLVERVVPGWGFSSENMANEAYERLMPLIEARGGQGEHDSKERAEVLRLLHLLHLPRHAAPAQTSDKAKFADGGAVTVPWRCAVHAWPAFSHRQVPVACIAVKVLAQDSPPAFLHLSCDTAAPAGGKQTDEVCSVGVGGEEECLFKAKTVKEVGAEEQEKGGSGGN